MDAERRGFEVIISFLYNGRNCKPGIIVKTGKIPHIEFYIRHMKKGNEHPIRKIIAQGKKKQNQTIEYAYYFTCRRIPM